MDLIEKYLCEVKKARPSKMKKDNKIRPGDKAKVDSSMKGGGQTVKVISVDDDMAYVKLSKKVDGQSKALYHISDLTKVNEAVMVPPGLSTKYTSYKDRPTRMQLQKELDKNKKTGMSIRKSIMDIEKKYKVKLTVRNDGTIVNIE